jgi:Family of unknown function (DUF6477)
MSFAQRQVVLGQDATVQLRSIPMNDCRTMLATLRRPRLLMRAARFGLQEYRRERDLRRYVGSGASPEDTVFSLMSVEANLEATRIAGDAAYSVARHIEVLIALLAEAQFLRRSGLA